MAKSSRSGLGGGLLLALAVVGLDQLTKVMAVRLLHPGSRVPVIADFFDLTLIYNTGAAFSFLAGASGWQRWFFIILGIVAALFLVFMLARHAGQRLFALGIALILGGAVGNVIDRIRIGKVVDFVLLYHDRFYWPAFNVADSAITLGVTLLIIDEIRRVRRSR
jgi:signal peptidase II